MDEKTFTCQNCGKQFVLTEGEQELRRKKGLENELEMCTECRKARVQRNSRNNLS